ncbi:MAG TPA: hypothetical protein VFQ23_22885 [Anaerolineales bacterium]|nr:hypothetical protein [Anaerolineales bacterium]
MVLASFVVLAYVAAAAILSWLYFRRYVMTRPPIGVFNLGDIAVMIGAIILVPFLYLLVPIWILASLLALASISILYFTWEPVFRSVWSIWLVTILLAGSDLATALLPGIPSIWFFAVNNIVLVISVIGVTNLWAQSGMKARHAAILGAALMVYDLIATSLLPLMNDLFIRLEGLPFAPEIAWLVNAEGDWLSIGLGDLVMAAVFPLVMRKAFGRTVGMIALVIGLGAITLLILSLISGLLVGTFPVMVVLGPLMVLQYVYWQRQLKQERTTWQYLQAEPLK